jgi:excinuclease UvrABC nuclease subunit
MRPLDEALRILANYYDKLKNVERKKFRDFVAVDTKIRVKGIPKEPGVYQIFEGGKLIYVGSARRLKDRIHNLFYGNHTLTAKLWKSKSGEERRFRNLREVQNFYLNRCTFNFITTDEYKEALALEGILIMHDSPIYNKV